LANGNDITATVEIFIRKRDGIMEITEVVIEGGKKLIQILTPELLKILKEEIERCKSKPHGSKVKEGVFKDCTIELAGDKALIAVNPEKGEVVWLTSDNIQSYQLVKEKERFHIRKYETYYYYYITFKDGSTCYARMRGKYRDAMINNV